MNAPRPQIRCREISEADLERVADLLTRGFAGRSRDYWMQGLRRQAAREVPQGYPRFGYMLDHEGVAGRRIAAALHAPSLRRRACDPLQSVELVCRAGVPQLRADADQDRAAPQRSHLFQHQPCDLDLADHRGPGFRAYCKGLFFSFPLLSRPAPGMTVEIVSSDATEIDGLERRCRAADAACRLWLPQPCLPHGARRHAFRAAADAHPPRLDLAARDAADLLPRCRRLRRLRRRDRKASCCGRARFPCSSTPMARWKASRASIPRSAAANISRARTGRGWPTSATPSSCFTGLE